MMNEEQTTVALQTLKDLMDITCKIDEKGCDGPWCSARQKIGVAFGLVAEPDEAS